MGNLYGTLGTSQRVFVFGVAAFVLERKRLGNRAESRIQNRDLVTEQTSCACDQSSVIEVLELNSMENRKGVCCVESESRI